MIGILGLNHGKLGGMRPGFIMCLWSEICSFSNKLTMKTEEKFTVVIINK
jgi:hypothetical protein